MKALDEMIAGEKDSGFVKTLALLLLDAMLAAVLLGHYHVRQEAIEAGWKPAPQEEFSEISDQAMPPEDAIAFFLKKQVMLQADFKALSEQYRPRAFTIARVEQMDLLDGAKKLLAGYLADDRGLETFWADLNAMFTAKGVTPLKPWHVELVYRNNMQTAYNAGRWRELQDPEMAEFFPLLEYHAVLDDRTRPTHRAMHGKRFRRDDKIWDTWWPPNGHACRCGVQPVPYAERNAPPDTPPTTTEDEKGNRIPVVPDPGFRHNPGTAWGQRQVDQEIGRRAAELGIEPPRLPTTMIPEEIKLIPSPPPRLSKMPIRGRVGVTSEGIIPEGIIPESLPEPTLVPPARTRKVRGVTPEPEIGQVPAPARGSKAPPLPAFDPDRLIAIPGTQKGTNPGGIYTDTQTGKRYYAKFYADPEQARTEQLAGKIYQKAGVEVPRARLAELADPSGTKRTAFVSDWMEDLSPISPATNFTSEQALDLARIHSTSAYLANWDVVGLDMDNILVNPQGRLTVIDAGGSLRFRALGKPKVFGPAAEEARTLLDPAINPQSADLFGAIYRRDVFLEREGAGWLTGIKDGWLKKAVQDSGISEGEELLASLKKRRDWLIDRYDLKGAYTYSHFGKHFEEFKAWGGEKLEVEVSAEGLTRSRPLRELAPEVMRRFEEYVDREIHPQGAERLQKIFQGWSDSSSSDKAALIKGWAEKRFGFQTIYHAGATGEGAWMQREIDFMQGLGWARGMGLDRETVFSLLDAEYEFHQYLLRRAHGYDPFKALRYMSEQEFRNAGGRGKAWGARFNFRPNNVQSMTVERGAFSGGRLLRFDQVRVEDILKSYYQGERYMKHQREAEYIVLGRPGMGKGAEVMQ